MPFNGLLFAAASCLLLPTTTTAQALWYYPNGRQSADVPCNISAPVSMCCGSAKACLSNGLCVLDGTTEDSGISYACGTCTDAQWTSGVCPLRCLLSERWILDGFSLPARSAYPGERGGMRER